MSAIYSIILLIFALFLIFSMIKINTSESSEMIRGMNFVGASAAVVLLAAVSGSLTKGSGAMQSVVLMESIGASFFVVTLAFFSIRSCGVNIPRAFSIPLIMYMILHCGSISSGSFRDAFHHGDPFQFLLRLQNGIKRFLLYRSLFFHTH